MRSEEALSGLLQIQAERQEGIIDNGCKPSRVRRGSLWPSESKARRRTGQGDAHWFHAYWLGAVSPCSVNRTESLKSQICCSNDLTHVWIPGELQVNMRYLLCAALWLGVVCLNKRHFFESLHRPFLQKKAVMSSNVSNLLLFCFFCFFSRVQPFHFSRFCCCCSPSFNFYTRQIAQYGAWTRQNRQGLRLSRVYALLFMFTGSFFAFAAFIVRLNPSSG